MFEFRIPGGYLLGDCRIWAHPDTRPHKAHTDRLFMLILRHWQAKQTPLLGLFAVRNFSCGLVAAAGHSKWQNIRHDKAKNDAKKAREAYALATRIQSSVKSGGVEGNAQLVTLMEKARKLNVTKKIIENAVKRGTGEMSTDESTAEVSYEFVGPGGAAFIIEANTDNKNRTVGLVKHAMTKFSANMSPCQYLFERKGTVVFEPLNGTEGIDEVLEVAIDVGAEDVEAFEDIDDDYGGGSLFRVVTDPADVFSVSNQLSERGYKLRDSTTGFLPVAENKVDFPVEHEKAYGKMMALLDEISEITNIYTNVGEKAEE